MTYNVTFTITDTVTWSSKAISSSAAQTLSYGSGNGKVTNAWASTFDIAAGDSLTISLSSLNTTALDEIITKSFTLLKLLCIQNESKNQNQNIRLTVNGVSNPVSFITSDIYVGPNGLYKIFAPVGISLSSAYNIKLTNIGSETITVNVLLAGE